MTKALTLAEIVQADPVIALVLQNASTARRHTRGLHPVPHKLRDGMIQALREHLGRGGGGVTNC